VNDFARTDPAGETTGDHPGSSTWNLPNNPFRLDAQAHSYRGLCMICGNLAVAFRDEISVKEYAITGTCQACQDVIFAEPEDEDDDYTEPAEQEDPYEADPSEPAEWNVREPFDDEPPF